MPTVIRYLVKFFVCCLLSFLFFGVLPDYANADTSANNRYYVRTTIPAQFGYQAVFGTNTTANFESKSWTPSSTQLVRTFDMYYGAYHNHFPSDKVFAFGNIDIPFSLTLSSLNYSDLSFSWVPDYHVFAGYYTSTGSQFDSRSLSSHITGTIIVNFSDGSSVSKSVDCFNAFAFSASKSSAGNQYIMSSSDFNLESNSDNQLSISSAEAVNLSTKLASISGYTSLSSGVVNWKYVQSLVGRQYVDIDSLNFESGVINTQGLGQLIVSSADFGLTAGNLVLTKGIVKPSLVTLDSASPDIVVTGITFTGNVNIPMQSFVEPIDYDNLPFFLANKQDSGYQFFYLVCNPYATISSSDTVLVTISSTLTQLYRYLRYDLPLYLRHLIIPTSEEVQDVIDDAVKDVTDNAGGLGEALGSVNDEIKSFQEALQSGAAKPLYIPAGIVNLGDVSYTLWPEFDVSPYFEISVVQEMTSFLVPFLEFFAASYVIWQLYYMFLSLLSGNSYFAYLRGIKTLYDEADEDD